MKIGIFGTGMVAKALADKLATLGHDVMMGTRNPEATLARSRNGGMGNPPFRVWQEQHPVIDLGTFADAARHGDLLINATNGAASLAALTAASADAIADKVLIDISVPLDFSHGMPPSLFVCNSDSLGEQIQRAFPRARVVKALNTVNASLMIEPKRLADGDHTIFVSGNDAEAKQAATKLLGEFGWTDVLDLGDISTARGTEMYLPLWLRLFGTVGTPMFSIKVVR
jgi:predicted dinucleotide-binding enzyme